MNKIITLLEELSDMKNERAQVKLSKTLIMIQYN